MDEILFYNYLNYQKEQNLPLSKKLLKTPTIMKIFIIISILAVATYTVFYFSPELKTYSTIVSFIASVVEALICIALYVYIERYQIKNSSCALEKRLNYCKKLSLWLSDNMSLTDDAIELLYKRLIEQINAQNADHKEQNNRVDKWIQVLVIPVILSIISSLISKQTDFSDMMTVTISLMFIILMIYFFIWIVRCILWFPTKRKNEQMKFFANDLQDIMDLKILNNTCNKTKQ